MNAPNKTNPPSSTKPSKPEIQVLPCSIKAEKTENSTKKEEYLQNHKNHDLVLDLSLCRNDLGSNNIDKYNLGETSQGKEEEPRVFSCNYCQRQFYSSQALGGHQNAHKRERTLAKRVRKTGSTSFGNYYPENLFKSSPNKITDLPLHGSCSNNNTNHRPVGIQAHSLIHKPSYLQFSSTISSHNGWSNVLMIDQQRPAIGRLGMGSPSSSSSAASLYICDGGGARFGNVQKNSQPSLDRNIGGIISWKGISVNNLKSSSKDIQDHDQLNKLDLSLKL